MSRIQLEIENSYQKVYQEARYFLENMGLDGKIYLAVLTDDFHEFRRLYPEYVGDRADFTEY